MILIEGCKTKAEFVEKIYEKQIEVLLIDYKMASTFGFNGTTLISYINDQIRDLECFILTAVDNEQISDGLVASRNIFAKTVFDTEGDDPEKVSALMEFIKTLKESADVFKKRREQKIDEYKALLKKRDEGNLGAEEEEFDEHLERNDRGYVVGKTLVGKNMCRMLHLDIRRTDIYWKIGQLRIMQQELEQMYLEGRLSDDEKSFYIDINMLMREYIDKAFEQGE